MYVHTEGIGYTVIIQNDKYAKINEKEGSGTATAEESKSLRDYLNKITESIPELKAAEESGDISIGVFILPNSSKTLQKAIDQTTQTMLNEGTDESVLKDVLGIIKDNHSADMEFGTDGVAHIKNDVCNYDMDALNNVLDKFKDIFTNNGKLCDGLGTFQDYVNDVYRILKNESSSTEEESTTTNTNNDLVDTFMQEIQKSEASDEEGNVAGSNALNKKLYGKLIKALKSHSTGELLQQTV